MLAFWMLALTPVMGGEPYWLGAGEYDQVRVVVAAGAPPSEHFAAAEFARLWEACTGYRPEVSSTHEPGAVNVWIGGMGCPYAQRLKLDGLGTDGYHMRSLEFRKRYPVPYLDMRRPGRVPVRLRHLVIAGGAPRGTIYGVYEFFHGRFGVRWLTPIDTHVPDAPAGIAPVNERYVPPVPYRDTNYWMFRQFPEFALKHRLNGNSLMGIPEEMGGAIGYAGGFGHTFYNLLSPEKYFEAHPEYFSLVAGERRPHSQLCLTNADVLGIVTERVRGILRESPPNRRIVSVTQMDWPMWCECEHCAALDAREGSQAGSLIHFVNAIAERIEDEFPDAFIDTFAYTYTRTPPRHVKPRDNVIVRLCSIEADFFRPLGDRGSRLNRAFQEDIRRWSRITKHLFIWDYTQNWHAFQQPHPNFHVLQPNVRFFADHGVTGIFEQAAQSPRSDFDYLKAYIVARALWDPDADWRALYDEFLALYYREAAPYIRAYHELITEKVRAEVYELTIFSRMDWMDPATVRRAQALFARAFAAAAGDPELKKRLDHAYVPVQHAALVCPPDIVVEGDAFLLTRPPSQTFDEYWEMIIGYGVTHLGDDPIEKFRERLDGQTPPREQVLPFKRLENDAYEVWVCPEAGGSVVRLRDKRHGIEFLTGHEAPLSYHGMIQDWHVMDPAAPVQEEIIARRYTLADEQEDSVCVAAALDNGLSIVRCVALEDNPPRVRVTLTLTNTGVEPVAPRVKLHPEFHLPAHRGGPRLFVRRAGAWTREDPQFLSRDEVVAGRIAPDAVDAWAVRWPEPRGYLVNTVAGAVGHLYYYYTRSGAHVNLEMVPEAEPLNPGEARKIEAAYQFVADLP
jgi:hypothetical protein